MVGTKLGTVDGESAGKTTAIAWREALVGLGLRALGVAVLSGIAALVLPEGILTVFVVTLVVGMLAMWTIRTLLEMQDRREAVEAVSLAVDGFRARRHLSIPATMLSPEREEQIVPFLGRDAVLAELLDWCTGGNQDRGRFRLITGPGGVGKTRLADELQRRLLALDTGWECLFLATAHQDQQAGAVAALREHARDRPVLVVVDLAEGRPGLRKFLTDALDDQGTIRVLMLARTAGDWWETLTWVSGDLGHALSDVYDGTDLPDIDADPRHFVEAAEAAYARELDVPAPEIEVDTTGMQPRALDLTTTALLAVLRNVKHPLATSEQPAWPGPITASSVFDELLRHETSYWEPTARQLHITERLTIPMRDALVAAVALVGVEDKPATVALAGRVLDTFTEDLGPEPELAAFWLRQTYTPRQQSPHWVEPLAPNWAAESLIVQVLTQGREATRLVTALLEGLTAPQAMQAMTVLSRAATDPNRDEAEQEKIRTLADHLANHLPGQLGALAAVLDVVPATSTRMAPTAALLMQRHADLLRIDESQGGSTS